MENVLVGIVFNIYFFNIDSLDFPINSHLITRERIKYLKNR